MSKPASPQRYNAGDFWDSSVVCRIFLKSTFRDLGLRVVLVWGRVFFQLHFLSLRHMHQVLLSDRQRWIPEIEGVETKCLILRTLITMNRPRRLILVSVGP